MKAIPREAGRATYSTKIRKLKELKLTDYQKEVIIGCILGDGCLCENWSKTNYRLYTTQSIDQKEYIFWKYSILKDLTLTEPRYYEKTRSLAMRTISHKELTEYRNIFYIQNKKIIPANITELIKSPVVLAIWFMDDGNVIKRNKKLIGYHLNTQSFSEEENKVLSCSLKSLYDINSNLELNHGKYRLAIFQKNSREIFISLIKEHIIPSMRYKLG